LTDHRVFFEHDEEIGRTVWLVFDEKGNLRGAHVEQNIDSIIEANAEAEKLTHGRPFGDYNRAASVPLTLMEKTGLDQAIDARDQRYVSKILNDSDYSKLRTSRGKV
jgi:hypothetical protein